MNALLETYIFYVDMYIIQNFLMKIIILYLSLWCMKQNIMISRVRGLLKLVAVAFLGTLLEVIGLLYMKPFYFLVPILIWYLLISSESSFFVFALLYAFFTLMVNAVLEVIWNYFGKNEWYIVLILFSAIVVLVFVKIWRMYYENQKGIYQIKLMHKGKEIFSKGYYDSGNCLKDPYSHKGVQIISKELLEQVLTGEEARVYIPYQSLGNENGMITVVYIDYILIFAERERRLEKVPVGIADDNLFKDKSYKVILNEGVL